ncbi:uncharacterized protein A1O5_00793 [Cladophialophora psammophila CBS 110553]|uniref:Uncharacterized protein n=1 Tax=Cladophialophora psammophila CBS 110553 TaxID=1182543 RepID=W9XG03_9EURO|nr:uncharacterized protein A1O5_00793 [Cladophialophora psammophila CBS 110553]EXJ76285.1 hypothetical protein A1O5_00793 [Cladophialophora psammophila CBS 110553]
MSSYDPEQSHRTEETPLLTRSKNETLSGNGGYATGFAAFGLAWTIMSLQAFIRWIASDDFHPAPLMEGDDKLATWRLVCLRLIEATSLGVLIGFFWFCVFSPLRVPRVGPDGIRKRQLTLDGRFVIGGMIAWASDAFLNCQQYIFSWNANNVNMGVWTRFMPFHREGGPRQYAESLLWGPPMYVYFCAGVALMACAAVKPIRRRWPSISKMTLVTIIWIGEFIFDFVVENIIIWTSHGYGYPKTFAPLTLWAGQTEQFPIYESILVASLGSLYTQMRLLALEDPNGLSPVEKGHERWPRWLQGTSRTFAVIGFCAFATVTVYHLPLNWLGVIGTSKGYLPSYMLPGSGVESLYPC